MGQPAFGTDPLSRKDQRIALKLRVDMSNILSDFRISDLLLLLLFE